MMKKILNEWKKFVKEANYDRAKTAHQVLAESGKIREEFRLLLEQLLIVLPGEGEEIRLAHLEEFFSKRSVRMNNVLRDDIVKIQSLIRNREIKKIRAGGWPEFTYEKTRQGVLIRNLGPAEEIPTIVFNGQPIGMAVAAETSKRLRKAENILRNLIRSRTASPSRRENLPLFTKEQIKDFYFQEPIVPSKEESPPNPSRWSHILDKEKDILGDIPRYQGRNRHFRAAKKRKQMIDDEGI